MGPGMGRPSLKGHYVQCAMSNVQCAMSLTHRALCAMSLTQRALCAMYGQRFFGHGREMLACEGNRQTRDLDSWALSGRDEGKLALRFERCDQRMKNTIKHIKHHQFMNCLHCVHCFWAIWDTGMDWTGMATTATTVPENCVPSNINCDPPPSTPQQKKQKN